MGECNYNGELSKIFIVDNNAKLGISNIIFTGESLINIIKGEVNLTNNNFIHCTDNN